MNLLSFETHHLLMSVSDYVQSIGKATSKARQARTLIEFYVASRSKTSSKLKNYLPALQAETSLVHWLRIPIHAPNRVGVGAVKKMVACSENQQKYTNMIQLATAQQFLGEDFTSLNDIVKDVKIKMSDHLGVAMEELARVYTQCEEDFFGVVVKRPALNNEDSVETKDYIDLESSMSSYLTAMKMATEEIESTVISSTDEGGMKSSRSIAGPLTRFRVLFHSVYSFVYELGETMSHCRDETIPRGDDVTKGSFVTKVKEMLQTPWLWTNLGKRRLAMKTALGMVLASMFVCIPHLREDVASPNRCASRVLACLLSCFPSSL